MKTKRAFLEPTNISNSYYVVQIHDDGAADMTLADCNRHITWWFGTPGSKRAIRKIAKIKKVIDELHKYLNKE